MRDTVSLDIPRNMPFGSRAIRVLLMILLGAFAVLCHYYLWKTPTTAIAVPEAAVAVDSRQNRSIPRRERPIERGDPARVRHLFDQELGADNEDLAMAETATQGGEV